MPSRRQWTRRAILQSGHVAHGNAIQAFRHDAGRQRVLRSAFAVLEFAQLQQQALARSRAAMPAGSSD
jgi:hypothetical protein